jgi:hypothetical protein
VIYLIANLWVNYEENDTRIKTGGRNGQKKEDCSSVGTRAVLSSVIIEVRELWLYAEELAYTLQH